MDMTEANLLTGFLIAIVIGVGLWLVKRKTLTTLLSRPFKNSTPPANFLSQNQFIEHLLDMDFTKNYALIDVREAGEYQKGHIQHAINIPHNQIMANTALLDAYLDKDIIVYCLSGMRSGSVCRAMNNKAANDKEDTIKEATTIWQLEGGIQQWMQHKRPLQTSE